MQQQGFTLIELVVTMVVLLAVSMLAVPAFQSSIGNSQVRTVTESISHGLQQARVEAIKRNTRVKFTVDNNGAWQYGCEVAAPGCPTLISSKSAYEGSSGNLNITADHATAIFTGFGTRDPALANGLTQVDVSNLNVDESERRALRVMLAAGGFAKICDPSVKIAGDPRAC